MASLESIKSTMQRVNGITGDGDNVVPPWVLTEMRRERAERRERAAATILGAAAPAG